MAPKQAPIWLTTMEQIEVMNFVSGFQPVMVWDPELRQFSDTQAEYMGKPVYSATVLLPVGWEPRPTPVEVRIAATVPPEIEVHGLEVGLN